MIPQLDAVESATLRQRARTLQSALCAFITCQELAYRPSLVDRAYQLLATCESLIALGHGVHYTADSLETIHGLIVQSKELSDSTSTGFSVYFSNI